MKKILLTSGLVILILSLFSQVPQAFKYQAVARDEMGNILTTQQVTLLIELMRGSNNGEMAYSEIHHCITNEFGLINIEIGCGEKRTGDFKNIDWGANSHFIRISIDRWGGEVFTPMGTSQLLSVPYALYAATSGSSASRSGEWDNNPYSDVFLHNDFSSANVGIGITTPGGKMHLQADGFNSPVAPILFIEHRVGYTSIFRRAVNNAGNALFLLQKARGTIQSPSSVQYGDNIGQIRMEGFDGTNYAEAGYVRILVDNTVTTGSVPGALVFATTPYGAGAADEQMRITSTGRVGVGLTNPGEKLDVNGVIRATGGNSQEWNTAYGWGDHTLAGYLTSETDPKVGGNALNYVPKWDGSALVTGTIYDNVNIGIGITTPSRKLEVNGDIKGVTVYAGAFSSTSPLLLQTNGTTRIYIDDTDGRVGMGTTAPEATAALDVTSTNTGFLPPRMSWTQIQAISNPAPGLIVYNTTDNGLMYFTGDNWNFFDFTCHPQPTTADAGPNQFITSATSATLAANTPISGTGAWCVARGMGGVFTDPGDPATTFTCDSSVFYSLRWTITNDCGSSHDDVNIVFCGPSFYDNRDTQMYSTTYIISQCWMSKNLNVGAMITNTTGMSNNDTIEKYCYNNSADTCESYGGLYQWDEMMDYVTTEGVQGICPDRFHLPTYIEWTQMFLDLGGNGVAGGKLKETGFQHWSSPNTGATDEYSFTALPGGYRYYDAPNYGFVLMKSIGFYWSSTILSTFSSNARNIDVSSSSDDAGQHDNKRGMGFSVRCILDDYNSE